MQVNRENSRPTLVLLHGWGLNHAVWQPTVDALKNQADVLALDLPGYGLNQTGPEPYSLATLADQLAAQIPAGSYLLGWSLGGLVATEFALRYPAKIKALALLASSPCFMREANWPGMDAAVMQQFAGALANNLALTVERFLAIQAMGSETARQDIKALKQAILNLPLPSAEVLQAGLRLLEQTDMRSRLADLSMPVAGCFGRLDSLVPVAISTLLPLYCPAIELTVLPKASHAPFISHAAEFLAWLQSWLGIEQPQAAPL